MDFTPSALLDGEAARFALTACASALAVATGVMALHMRSRLGAARSEHRNMVEMVENLDEGVYRSSLDGRQLSANKALVALNGYASEAEMLAAVGDIGKEWYVNPERRKQFSEALNRDGTVRGFVSEIYRHKSRERIWITESARIVRHRKTGKPLYYEGTVRDITETVRRFELERQFTRLTGAVPGVLFQLLIRADGGYAVPFVSAGFEVVTGLTPETLREHGTEFTARVAESDREAFRQALYGAVSACQPLDHEFRFRRPDGEERWFRVSATPERTADGVLLHGYLNDISLRKNQALEIEKLAFYDALTGLPNRRLLRDRAAAVVERCRRERRFGALLFIDLDNFKPLNDTQGHDVGDEYLAQVADRLRGAVGPDDTVARIGGDEFVVLLSDLGYDAATGLCQATTTAQTVLRELSATFHLGIVQHQSSASIGFVAFDGSPVRVEDLLKRADIAMYEAKSAGRNRIAVFDPAVLVRETDRYELVRDLRFAISEHRFELMLQPRVSRGHRVCGAQANVVWRHPTQGVIAFDEFAPLAAQIGLADDLARVVAALGVGILRRWQDGPATRSLRLALNIGVAPLAHSDFAALLERLVTRLGVDASKLTLEIGAAFDPKTADQLAAGMRRLKALGIRFSLDRFGSGQPPLESLKVLPFDEVRVVGRFVTEIAGGHYDRTMARLLIQMARELGLATVAGDVASPEQEDLLAEAGCETFEGPNYGAALPQNAFIDLVAAQQPRLSTPPLMLAATA